MTFCCSKQLNRIFLLSRLINVGFFLQETDIVSRKSVLLVGHMALLDHNSVLSAHIVLQAYSVFLLCEVMLLCYLHSCQK